MTRHTIIANWKMNGNQAEVAALTTSAMSLASEIPDSTQIILCPPALYLYNMAAKLATSRVQLGAQDCHHKQKGAFTGDMSAKMLKNAGASHVIIGHSERRQYHHETDEIIREKAVSALAAGLIPILCIGESLKERELGQAESLVVRQMLECLPDTASQGKFLLAYEPIWAIGTGLIPEKNDILRMHKALYDAQVSRFSRAIPVVYGGSVNEENAADILATPYVAGVLVGGASLNAETFAKIAKAANN